VGTRSTTPHERVVWVAGGLYVLLTLLVAVHLTDPVDAAVRQWFRPDDVWGPTQLKADRVVEGLSPTHVAPLLLVSGLLSALVRRSWEPLRLVLQIGLATIAVVVVTQLVLGRPDTHGEVARLSGSYPSGHTAVLLAVLGGSVLALAGRFPWWLWPPAILVDLVMGWCLLLEAAHWPTDVLGGLLASVAVLSGAAFLRERRVERVEVAVSARQR